MPYVLHFVPDFTDMKRMQMRQSSLDSVQMVVQAITVSITQPRETMSSYQLDAALKCLVAWMPTLPGR